WDNPTPDFWLAIASCFDRVLAGMDTSYFVRRYTAVKNPKLILRLALARYWTNELILEIDRIANSQDIGKNVWRSGLVGAFYQHQRKLVPKKFKVAGETEDDRFNRALDGFQRFVQKKEKQAESLLGAEEVTQMSSIMFKSLPSDWYKTANLFVKNDLRACVETFYPIIGGKLEPAPLDIFSRFRDYYESHSELRPRTTGEKITAQVIYPGEEETITDLLQRLCSIKPGEKGNLRFVSQTSGARDTVLA